MSGDNKEPMTWGSGGLFAYREFYSLALMLTTPLFLITLRHICFKYNGSVYNYWQNEVGDFNEPLQWSSKWFFTAFNYLLNPFDAIAWKYIGSFMAFELLLMRFFPGKVFKATVTPSGHVPVYNANGVQCYVITIVAFFALWHFEIIDPTVVYTKFGEMLAAMNFFALCLCSFLTVKGLNFPSTKDSGTNGSIIVDFFWGTELYPRILGWDVKQFTNCRFGMMYWQVGILCYAAAQYTELTYVSSSMFISVLLQTVYIAKFFWWETGYFCSMDIQHDRAGYYICWGCLVWLPSIYTMHTYFLVTHPELLSLPMTMLLSVSGIFCIWCNYDCDLQRQEFRATGGRLKIWGKDPEFIEAKYLTKDGEERSSLLLASGWWGLARHFHYIPEISAAIFWCVPALYGGQFYPVQYFYPTFLTLLLADRAWRDDKRCADKYGEYWVEYCKKVPSKIVPGLI